MVGNDPNINSSLTWEKLKEQNWNRTSLVRSGHSYEGLFSNKFWTGHSTRSGSKLQGLVLQGFLQKHSHSSLMARIMCPWSPKRNERPYTALRARCGEQLGAKLTTDGLTLFDFLRGDSAKEYFNPSSWTNYGTGWEGVAFLSLLRLWSADLTHVNYGRSSHIFERKSENFSLSSLIKPGKDVIFASLDSEGEKITYIDKYSSNKWAVLLKGGSGKHESSQSLSVTLSEGELCIRELICLEDSELSPQKNAITNSLSEIHPGYFGSLWTVLFQGSRKQWDYKIAFMALLAAAFNSPEDVVVSVQEPSKEGKMIFKLIEEKK